MSKVWKLKRWLQIEQATKHIATILTDPDVSAADLLHLALEGQLRLSAVFTNHVLARECSFVDAAAVRFKEARSLDGLSTVRLYDGGDIFCGPAGETFQANGEVFQLSADEPYELLMAGGERGDVAQRFWELSGIDREETISIDGTFVASRQYREATYFQLLGTAANSDGKRFEYPLGGLPTGAALVISQDEIQRFVSSLKTTSNFELEAKERNSLLNIIGALVELIQNPRNGRNSQSAVIDELVENFSDAPGVSKRNLEKKFADAKRSLKQL